MRHLLPQMAMTRTVSIDDTARSRAQVRIEERVFHDFNFARSMAIDIFPCVGIDIRQLIGRYANNFAVLLMCISEDIDKISP